ncbi:MAG: transposase [Bacteroidaceae bacterium]|nr:transposase [Bacteroidaceae bacterium]
MINFSKFNSLYSVATYFNAEEKCQQAIVESRWGDDVVCPYCGKHHCHKRADGRFCSFRDMFAASIGVVDYNMVQMLEMAA